MSVIPILILVSLALALVFLGGFIWAVRAGQYEDTYTPSLRVLLDEASKPSPGTAPGKTEREGHFRKAGDIAAPRPGKRPDHSGGAAGTTKAQI